MRTLLLVLALLPHITLAEKPPESSELIRTLHEGNHFKPYTDKAAWQKRAVYLREQVLISAGLWPMPEKGPLNAVIHGRIERNDYTIEKVYFESYPGFYVTGNLYRPKGKSGPFPAVLSPHGHWTNGRLYEAPDKEVKKQLDGGWEKEENAARYPMQARCAGLARLGCIVFFYDMVGYADADPEHFPHKTTYRDLDSDLHGLSVFGLQTWDSIRSIDFLESLPDVDRKRIAITGASGGASQTIMMMATDDRIAVAAPVNMISAGEHQGGCVCENNSLLRVGTDNVELAATFAPKPFIHPTATGDWTKDFLEQGFPEIQATYKLFGAETNVESMRQTAPHNYNLHAREAVYHFFNTHLKLGHEGVVTEQKFTPVKPKDLSVWDAEHPRPKNAVDAAGLKKWWVEMTARQMEALKPKDTVGLSAAKFILDSAILHLLGMPDPQYGWDELKSSETNKKPGYSTREFDVHLSGKRRRVSLLVFDPPSRRTVSAPPTRRNSTVVVFPEGKSASLNADGTPVELIAKLLEANFTCVVPDLTHSGEYTKADPTNPLKSEFYTGYNPTLLACRVEDILAAMRFVSGTLNKANLVGVRSAGSWCILASAAANMHQSVRCTIVDASALDAAKAQYLEDSMYLPLILRYGGVEPFASLIAPTELTLYNMEHETAPSWLKATYDAAGASNKLHVESSDAKPEDIVHYLTR